uniref:Uncharacterized protein n=1 Tax=Timema bartmani TaxID=61472 RepID=A0A7R9F8X7_9NEOP|nr:unnamed protein product [Timema bartmani]
MEVHQDACWDEEVLCSTLDQIEKEEYNRVKCLNELEKNKSYNFVLSEEASNEPTVIVLNDVGRVIMPGQNSGEIVNRRSSASQHVLNYFEVFQIIKLGPQLLDSALALKCSCVDVPGFQNIFRRGDVFSLFFHFFLPLFIARLLLLPDYISVVEGAPNCDVIICCYVLLIRAVWA